MDDDKLTAQFSSGQLVIGICVSLFVLLAAFLLGVLVGKYDSSLRNPEVAAPQGVQTTSVPTKTLDGGGRQTTPRRPEPVTLPPIDKPEVDTSQGRVTELAPLPANPPAGSAPAPAPPAMQTIPPPPPPVVAPAPVSTPIEPPSALPATAPATTPPPVVTAANAPVPATVVPEEAVPAPVVTPPPPPPPVLEPSTPPEPEDLIAPVAPQGFGIQVISLSGPDRAAKAVEVQRKLQSAGYQSIVTQYEGGKKYAVMAVGFADKAAAETATQELRKIKEFKDCFIKKLS